MNDPSHVAQVDRDISQEIVGAAIEVHQQLGPGLLESVYQRCMELELTARNIRFQSQKRIAVSDKGILLEEYFVVDLRFPEGVIVEIKAVSSIASVHGTQLQLDLELSRSPWVFSTTFLPPTSKMGSNEK